jgi:hypothetical protein
LPGSTPRAFDLNDGPCPGIPAGVEAYSLNVTATNTQGTGFILIHPTDGPVATVSTLNYVAGQTIANAAVVAAGTNGSVDFTAGVSGADLIVDINGYYAGALITGVTAGTGLSGGGASGNLTLDVVFGGGGMAAAAARSDHDHFGQSWSGTASNGLFITNAGTRAIRGHASATSGLNSGVVGESSSNSGKGVLGRALSTTGSLAYGVHGESLSSDGRGVFGHASAATGDAVGVYGRSDASGGAGVVGEAIASAGATIGVVGSNESNTGYGGYFASSGGGVALYATGGVSGARVIDTSTGAYLSSAGVWTNNSDRAAKENLETVDRQELLARLARLPISTWNYKVEPVSVRHLGPMAQDFAAVFGLGNDDKAISTLDTGGVALAAIQGLYELILEKEARIGELEGRLREIERRDAEDR